ncbi:hypothetical protein HU830_03095 [Lactobacillus sp. DCY120]|uniref:SGNH hydrolase-type esterase domain-containing protein n=1 Tax=Bombilactobacillus apium TaxID=2675299 RepID=A0A850QZP8_9LACO|nr:GDSL-type esterase/lipase family protein [Bombilactobacillus apium]NVY96163.1 hypothetical protein [Bombilactobacillus apium]
MPTIALFGDDLLAGFQQETVTDAVTTRLQQAFPNQQLRNLALPGQSTAQALTHVERDVVSLQAAIVILFFGSTDLDRKRQIKVGIFAQNLNRLVQKLQPAQIILVSPPAFNSQLQPRRAWPRQLQFALAVEHLAQKYDLPYINLLQAMQKKEAKLYFREDGLTFNDQGYELLSQLLDPVISQLLQNSSAATSQIQPAQQ